MPKVSINRRVCPLKKESKDCYSKSKWKESTEGEKMRILSSTANNHTQRPKKKAARSTSEPAQKQIVGKTTGGQSIVKKQRTKTLSESEIRAKIEDLKNPKSKEEAKPKKPHFDTSMDDDMAVDMKRKSPIKKGKDLEIARKKSEVKTKVEVIQTAKTEKAEATEGLKEDQAVEGSEKPKKLVNAQGEEIRSDVGLNDPKDPATQEKLKELLKTNAFSFSQKEKDALANILNK